MQAALTVTYGKAEGGKELGPVWMHAGMVAAPGELSQNGNMCRSSEKDSEAARDALEVPRA
eukprot:338953-Pleurochrysis_carterae.AAC.1